MKSLRVFLIDHAWTYKLNEARQTLSDNENLLERMINLMNIKLDDYDEESTVKSLKEFKVDAVIDNMWKFNQTYKISTEKMVFFSSIWSIGLTFYLIFYLFLD